MNTKRRVFIFYPLLLTPDGKDITVGGIQNYLIGLSEIFLESDFETSIIQTADIDFETSYNGHKIRGIKTDRNLSFKRQIRHLYNRSKASIDKDDIIIWGSDRMAIKVDRGRTIAIQHGISYDYIPYESIKFGSLLRKNNYLGAIYKFFQCVKAIRDFGACKTMVCVDYNYMNWIRTVMPRSYSDHAVVIPNYAETMTESSVNDHVNSASTIRILFARRFQFMRGVPILIKVMETILQEYNNVEFTVCGDGPMKKDLENKFKNNPRVNITKYSIGEAHLFNLKHHITLVPTFGSEGTSFSLLEGMAAGAVPIVSNVGGMTNVILDGFNGFMASPNHSEFISKIKLLLDEPEKLTFLSQNARLTIESSFSKHIWKLKWLEFIKKI